MQGAPTVPSPGSRRGLDDWLRGAAQKDVELLAVPRAKLPAGRDDDALAAVAHEHGALQRAEIERERDAD